MSDAERLAQALSPEERQSALAALTAEYGVLMAALTAVWNASVVRTSVFLGVLSAAACGGSTFMEGARLSSTTTTSHSGRKSAPA